MPRIPHSTLLRGRRISPLLPLLLRTCRTLPSACNELRWLREHVRGLYKFDNHCSKRIVSHLTNLCVQRSRGVPLQYLLGSQPFGDLDIICRRGVLIPRPETEAYVFQLVKLLCGDEPSKSKRVLRVLDLCTGSGCISLLTHSLLSQHYSNIQILGLDISDAALELARDNLRHNINLGHLDIRAEQQISFEKLDIFQSKAKLDCLGQTLSPWDIVISNPPYISEEEFDSNTERSVRKWEPKLALVPPFLRNRDSSGRNAEDVFYYRILNIATDVSARIALMEVGDTEQALRVASIAQSMGKWRSIEIWRDWPDQHGDASEQSLIGNTVVPIIGSGLCRSVLCRK